MEGVALASHAWIRLNRRKVAMESHTARKAIKGCPFPI